MRARPMEDAGYDEISASNVKHDVIEHRRLWILDVSSDQSVCDRLIRNRYIDAEITGIFIQHQSNQD
jgi:hypothetical protein